MREIRRRHLAAGAALAAVLPAGCGGGDGGETSAGSTSAGSDEADVLAVVDQLREAQTSGDSAAACDVVDGDLSVEGATTGNAVEVPYEQLVSGTAIPVLQEGARVISVSGDTAEVKDVAISGASLTIELSRTADGWRISAMKVP